MLLTEQNRARGGADRGPDGAKTCEIFVKQPIPVYASLTPAVYSIPAQDTATFPYPSFNGPKSIEW